MLMWNGQHKQYIHFYGHVHNSDEEKVYQHAIDMLNFVFDKRTKEGRKDCPQVRAINVGVMMEYINYCPRTVEEILNH